MKKISDVAWSNRQIRFYQENQEQADANGDGEINRLKIQQMVDYQVRVQNESIKRMMGNLRPMTF